MKDKREGSPGAQPDHGGRHAREKLGIVATMLVAKQVGMGAPDANRLKKLATEKLRLARLLGGADA